MVVISRPAVRIEQGTLTVYLTYVTPQDLALPEFYTVDKLDPQSGSGFQRILDDRRANRLTRHLREAFPTGYANLPTTIFLATDKQLEFDTITGQLQFETDDVCPFSVVDGQHRIAGLVQSAQHEPRLQHFQLPAAIATSLDDAHQMYHFFVVNTTQKPVDTALAQQITKRFTETIGITTLPYLPFWIESEVSKGTDALAIELIEYLNTEATSPLVGRIRMANDSTPPKGRINQSSIVNMLKQHVFVGNNPIFMQEHDQIRRHRIMNNYFNAVHQVFVDDLDKQDTLVYGNNGIFFFLVISKWVFADIYSTSRNLQVGSIVEVFKRALDNLDDPYSEMADPEWWRRGGDASSIWNRAGATEYANAFLAGLQLSQPSEAII